MLQVYSVKFYALLDPSAILSFVTHLVSIKFYVLPHIFNEAYVVSTAVGNLVVAKRVYSDYPIMFLQ